MPKTIDGLPLTEDIALDDKVAIWRATNGDSRKITRRELLEGYVAIAGAPLAGRMASWVDNHTLIDSGANAADIYQKTQVYLVDKNFTDNVAQKRFNTILAAISNAPLGSIISIAPGVYTENITLTQNGTRLIGSGRPWYDGTNLVGGTLIVGQININGKNGCTIRSLGVDVRTFGLGDRDAIVDNRLTQGDAYNSYIDLSVVGVGLSSQSGHGILLSGGHKNFVHGCNFFVFYHGLVFRCSDSIASDCYFFACTGNSIIVKSETPSGNALNNTITNCILDGRANDAYFRAGMIRVTSSNPSLVTRNTTISNITVRNSGEAAVMVERIGPPDGPLAGGTFDTMISNVSCNNGGDASIRAEFKVRGSCAGIHFNNCASKNRAAGWGIEIDTAAIAVRIIGCSIDFTGNGAFTGYADYVDLGSSAPIQRADFGHIGLEPPTIVNLMRQGEIVTGRGQCGAINAYEDVLRFAWNSAAGGYSAIAVDITFISSSGGFSTIYTRRVALQRPGTSAINGSIGTLGTDTASAAGSQGTLSIILDLATANQATVRVASVGFASTVYAYVANIITTDMSVWNVTNLAAN